MVYRLTESKEKTYKVLVCGYGIGLSWAVGSISVNTKDILPLVHFDDYYDDGLF